MSGQVQFPIGSPSRTTALHSLARALFLSFCAHAALLGVVWHFASNRQPQPMQRMLNLELAPPASAAVAPATPPQPASETQRDEPVREVARSGARVRAPAIVSAPGPAVAESADAMPPNAVAYAPSTPVTTRSQPNDALAIDLRILDWLAQYRTYPLAARRARIEGVVQLRVTLMPDGKLVDARIERSSGHAILDRAALELVSRAARLPDDFGSARSGQIELQLPIVYRMRT